MKRFLLAIGLLSASGHVWPSLYNRSSSQLSFLIIILLGFVSFLCLAWALPTLEQSDRSPLGKKRLALLVLFSLPVAMLEVAFAVVYWLQLEDAPLHLGWMASLPITLLIVWIVADAGVRGFTEEAVFRGLLQRILITKYRNYSAGVWMAILVTTFWFVVAHVYGIADLRFLPYVALASIWYGYLAAQTQRVLSSAILHMLHNVLALLVAYIGPLQGGWLNWLDALGGYALIALAFANFVAIRLLAKKWGEEDLVVPARAGAAGPV